jgi:hypothetical protein
MKVVICGSRDLQNYQLVEEAVTRSGFEISTVLSGSSRGVDRLGIAFARNHHHPVQVFMPEWERFGKRAGMVRNREMAQTAEAVIAIWDGQSRGTRNIIELASNRHLPCFVLLVNCNQTFNPKIKGVAFAHFSCSPWRSAYAATNSIPAYQRDC